MLNSRVTQGGGRRQRPLPSTCSLLRRPRWEDRWEPAAGAVKHTTRTLSGTPSKGAAIAMDGGVADTACYYTGRYLESYKCLLDFRYQVKSSHRKNAKCFPNGYQPPSGCFCTCTVASMTSLMNRKSSFKGVRIQVYEITTVHHCESMIVLVLLSCISRGAARPRVQSVHEKKRASHGIIYLGS